MGKEKGQLYRTEKNKNEDNKKALARHELP